MTMEGGFRPVQTAFCPCLIAPIIVARGEEVGLHAKKGTGGSIRAARSAILGVVMGRKGETNPPPIFPTRFPSKEEREKSNSPLWLYSLMFIMRGGVGEGKKEKEGTLRLPQIFPNRGLGDFSNEWLRLSPPIWPIGFLRKGKKKK